MQDFRLAFRSLLTAPVASAVVILWVTRFASALLYDLKPDDPLTLLSATIVLVAAGALAGWLPASRASRLNPAEVLREA